VYLLTEERQLQKMITALKLNWVHDDVTAEHFPLIDDPTADLSGMELLHLDEELTTTQVKLEMDKRGYKPEGLRSLLVWGARNAEVQRLFPVAALRSSWVDPFGLRAFPYLYKDDDGRGLALGWDGPYGPWNRRCRFLVSRKESRSQ
jgi:hypothetical protein